VGLGVDVGAGVGDCVGDGVAVLVVPEFVPAVVVVLGDVPVVLDASEPVDPAPPQADNDIMAAHVMPPRYSRDLLIIVLLIIVLFKINMSSLYLFKRKEC
jgi:hypothetical protein